MDDRTEAEPREVDLVVVGGGPRAVALVERLTARATADESLRVVVIDAVEVGAGATWRTDQSGQLLNNTYSAHTTIYPDDSTPMSGPVTTGPDLVDWAREVAAGVAPGSGHHRSDTPRDTPAGGASAAVPAGVGARSVNGGPPRPEWLAEEVAGLEPWSFPSRRLQGVYFREQLAAILARGGVELEAVHGTVVAIDPPGGSAGGSRVVRLADGRSFRAAAVVLAQGMVQARRDPLTTERVAAAQRHGLTYIEPGMPAERDWDVVPAGQDVLVAGLGANFFDVIALLTTARGGRLVAGEAPFDLTYRPSGREPRLLVGSRRGLPYRAKSWYGRLPAPYRPQLATPAWFAAAAETPDQDFDRDIWPQVARELVVAHLATLAAHHPEAVPGIVSTADTQDPAVVALPAAVLDRIATTPAADLPGLVRELVAGPEWWLDPARLDRPDVRDPSPAQWQDWTRRWRRAELASISSPLTSPRASVNRAMAVLRGQVARLVTGGAISAVSAAQQVNGWFASLGLVLASGPPPERTALLLALVEAGVVELLGEGTTIDVENGELVARSQVRGRTHRARALIETRMSKGDVAVTDDPLLRSLLDAGRARLYTRRGPDGRLVTTRSLDVTPEEFCLVDAAGRPDPRLLVLGIPAQDVQPGSAIGATPGVPSPLIAGADRAAAQVLTLAREAVRVG